MDDVRYAVRDGIAEIALAHPPVNALTFQRVRALIAALQRAAHDDTARAVVLCSDVPGRFCAGLDLKALDGQPPDVVRELLDALYPGLVDAQRALAKPSSAAIAGTARGGGLTLAIACDPLGAGRDASVGYPEIDLGVLPAIHFEHLHRIVGRYRAFDLLFTGRSFGAEEAERLGLVSRVVAPGQALAAARELAGVIAAKPPQALRRGRTAFHEAADRGFRVGVSHAVETFCNVALSSEGRAGVAAFAARNAKDKR
ncbi:MAG: enoyl-CoA hydratase/isomerase family protein [Rubrivivax sp.]|nr:enoyl-CoA hydratase/isomerase family protein [Rubrivivax sp.]